MRWRFEDLTTDAMFDKHYKLVFRYLLINGTKNLLPGFEPYFYEEFIKFCESECEFDFKRAVYCI